MRCCQEANEMQKLGRDGKNCALFPRQFPSEILGHIPSCHRSSGIIARAIDSLIGIAGLVLSESRIHIAPARATFLHPDLGFAKLSQ